MPLVSKSGMQNGQSWKLQGTQVDRVCISMYVAFLQTAAMSSHVHVLNIEISYLTYCN